MAKKSKDVKKLRKAVKELQGQNEDLAKAVEKLRKNQKESREELENIVRDLESRLEASPDRDSDTGSAVTIGADGAIASDGQSSEEVSEESSDTPAISADDEIEGVGEPIEESSDAPTVSADDGISSSDAPKASVKATESAKRKADELGVDLTGVEGTGSRDRITVGDVEKAAGKR